MVFIIIICFIIAIVQIKQAKKEIIRSHKCEIYYLKETLIIKLNKMSQELDRVVQEVSENTTVTGSAITLLNSLSATVADIKAQLAAQGIDNATLNQLATDLDTNTNSLADAVAANTPGE